MWFLLINLFMFWVRGICTSLYNYKLFPLRCFCGLYDLNSLSISFFLWTQAFTLEPRSIISMSTRRWGDDHSAVLFYYKVDDASPFVTPEFSPVFYGFGFVLGVGKVGNSGVLHPYYVLLIIICSMRPNLGQMLTKFFAQTCMGVFWSLLIESFKL